MIIQGVAISIILAKSALGLGQMSNKSKNYCFQVRYDRDIRAKNPMFRKSMIWIDLHWSLQIPMYFPLRKYSYGAGNLSFNTMMTIFCRNTPGFARPGFPCKSRKWCYLQCIDLCPLLPGWYYIHQDVADVILESLSVGRSSKGRLVGLDT